MVRPCDQCKPIGEAEITVSFQVGCRPISCAHEFGRRNSGPGTIFKYRDKLNNLGKRR